MPETPTPGVNGQVVGFPALQASRSISSFEPAARIVGLLASTASAGSFCLFWANGEVGLPTVTSVSLLKAATGRDIKSIDRIVSTENSGINHFMVEFPLINTRTTLCRFNASLLFLQ